MTQTVNENNNVGNSQKLRKPGQRQQDRLQRQARRRRRQRIWSSTIISVAIVILAVVGIVQYQRYSTDRAAALLASSNASATKTASLHATATVAAMNACLSKLSLPPTATAGLVKPPTLTQTPVTLPDGLQYIDVQTGCGPISKSGSNVSLEYTGWLQSSSKKFDSSYDHGGSPLSFQLGQGKVIKGFDEGLFGMQQGGIRRIIIPAALAYGTAGSPPAVPPNSVLIFDIQMLQVN
jgi:FKBP-type peptidyl-prolyl cis-trans isomerase